MTEHTYYLPLSAPLEAPHRVSDAARIREKIALAAYYRAKARGFSPGGELGDWLEAEREISAHDADK